MEFNAEERALLKGNTLIKTDQGEVQVADTGFSDVTNAPDWVKVRILEIRKALINGKEAPPPSREYIQQAELRRANAVALGTAVLNRVFPAGRPSDVDAENRKRLAEIEGRIKQDAQQTTDLATMSSDELRAELARRMGGMDTLPCPAQTLSASRADHLQAAEMHSTFARKAADVGRKDEALGHYRAAEEHNNAASVLDDDEGDADDRSQTLTRCMQSCRDSFAFGAGATSAPDFGGWQK
jgi:hypothetical protein